MIDRLRADIRAALKQLGLEPDTVQLDRPKDLKFGDLSTNAPLLYAKQLRQPPLELARQLKELLALDPDVLAEAKVAPPGFLNFTLTDPYLQEHTRQILASGGDYGRSELGKDQRALVEFVSANPTGPLTVGHGRGAILGDTISNILEWNGYQVEREYYYNDAGRQMRLLGESVRARYLEALGRDAQFPEEGYQGDYIREIAVALIERQQDTLADETDSAPFTAAAENAIFEEINGSLKNLGVIFNNYFNERILYDNGALDKVIATLEKQGLVYHHEGATWLKATKLGRPDDRVLIKSSGEPTYRLPDIAYHAHKLDRGYDLLVDIFGADHKGTYPDVLAGLQGLGYKTDNIRVLIHQFVTFTRGGKQVKMSTRKAEYVTLDELIGEVGRDVVRYFFLMRSMDSHLNFDLDLARQQSDDNPVYYLQYAHARMCNIAGRVASFGYTFTPDEAPVARLALPEERKLMYLLWWFPQVVIQVHRSLEPMTMAYYLQEIATAFHYFYAHVRVLTDDEPLSQARLVLTAACRQTLANGLSILGIAAPERM